MRVVSKGWGMGSTSWAAGGADDPACSGMLQAMAQAAPFDNGACEAAPECNAGKASGGPSA
jgi:hypothetical protein